MNFAIVLSGGVGTRMGLNKPKQYVEIAGVPIIEYCLKTLSSHPMLEALVIGVADEWLSYVKECVSHLCSKKEVFYSKPGETRQGTIINALKVAKEPMLTAKLVTDCLQACKDADAVLPVIPVKDTTYLSKDGKNIDSLLERKTLWNGQAPEAFRFGSYYEANMKLTDDEINRITGSTEVSYRAGLKCVLIPGDTNNFKITTPEDLSNFESIIKNESL